MEGLLCTVFVRDGKHFIRTPKGEELVGIVFTRVHDGADNEDTTCVVKLMVQLEENKK